MSGRGIECPDELCVVEHVAGNERLELPAAVAVDRQRDVERPQAEEVAMPADRRLRPSPRRLVPVVRPLLGSSRQAVPAGVGVELVRGRRDVVDDPVDEDALGSARIGRIGIFDDEKKALRARGLTTPPQRRRDVAEVRRVLARDGRAAHEARRFEDECHGQPPVDRDLQSGFQ